MSMGARPRSSWNDRSFRVCCCGRLAHGHVVNHEFPDTGYQKPCKFCGNTRYEIQRGGINPDADQCLGRTDDAPIQRGHDAAIGRMNAKKVVAERKAADVARDDQVRKQMRESIMSRKWGE